LKKIGKYELKMLGFVLIKESEGKSGLKMLGFDLIEVNLKTVKSGSYFL
jgi:hypothetical protein